MAPGDSGEITQRLARWAQGDRGALDSLMPEIYAKLRRIADGYLRRERSGHTLQPTALVNEAWMRLAGESDLSFENRDRFFALAAQVMRQVLVDYARGARAGKRGGGALRITLPDSAAAADTGFERFLALNEALDRLAAFSPRQARIIEMRYFAGLNVSEVAGVLDVSRATICREQRSAEAWLNRTMSDVTGASSCPSI
jgi:RNA polymerase sigma factor (TIGR02999 family)